MAGLARLSRLTGLSTLACCSLAEVRLGQLGIGADQDGELVVKLAPGERDEAAAGHEYAAPGSVAASSSSFGSGSGLAAGLDREPAAERDGLNHRTLVNIRVLDLVGAQGLG
ncbi:hypothetical protein ACUN0C_18625 [Faunimonas sp. B44]|uniref:hypothetical protein n=1 Tax=Faunimonas sp. B44 TaxID=3461493 RepID=UPI004044B172